MRYRQLGRTGIYVSELCLGTMTFGGKGFWEVVGKVTLSEAVRFIGEAFDAGVNFIDTADVYSEGEAEKITGEALTSLSRPRDHYIVATKVYGRTGPGPNEVGLSRGHILSSIDASLKRLRLEYIDLYQIHGADLQTPIEETIRALETVVQSGKARYIGMCNLPAWMTMKALAFSRHAGLSKFVSAQMHYSVASRDIEREIVPLAQDQGLAILPWSPLAGGLLSGKFDPDNKGPEGARRSSFDFPPVDKTRLKTVLVELRSIAAALNTPAARVALAWLLARPFVTSVIIGAKTRAQLAENLSSVELHLDQEHLARLDAAGALPPEYPGWMVERQNRDRGPAIIL